jgi:hypothetical protein
VVVVPVNELNEPVVASTVVPVMVAPDMLVVPTIVTPVIEPKLPVVALTVLPVTVAPDNVLVNTPVTPETVW